MTISKKLAHQTQTGCDGLMVRGETKWGLILGAQGLLHMGFSPVPDSVKLHLDKEPFGNCIMTRVQRKAASSSHWTVSPKTHRSTKGSYVTEMMELLLQRLSSKAKIYTYKKQRECLSNCLLQFGSTHLRCITPYKRVCFVLNEKTDFSKEEMNQKKSVRICDAQKQIMPRPCFVFLKTIFITF